MKVGWWRWEQWLWWVVYEVVFGDAGNAAELWRIFVSLEDVV
jgi:hypothetical protein